MSSETPHPGSIKVSKLVSIEHDFPKFFSEQIHMHKKTDFDLNTLCSVLSFEISPQIEIRRLREKIWSDFTWN